MAEAKWYVAHTYSGYENKVATNLEKIVENRDLHHLIQDVRVPTHMVVDSDNDSQDEVERKVFPGYVLVKMVMMDDTWYIVRNIRGVTGFVGPGSKPVPLTDDEVRKLGLTDDSDNAIKHVVKVSFAVGDSVKVVSGSLQGYVGTVSEITDETVKLKMHIFGKETLVECKLSEVEVIS